MLNNELGIQDDHKCCVVGSERYTDVHLRSDCDDDGIYIAPHSIRSHNARLHGRHHFAHRPISCIRYLQDDQNSFKFITKDIWCNFTSSILYSFYGAGIRDVMCFCDVLDIRHIVRADRLCYSVGLYDCVALCHYSNSNDHRESHR